MIKLIMFLAIATLIISCNTTTTSEDIMMLQKAYPNSAVYKIDSRRYIVADSTVIDVRVTGDGQIYSTVEIK